MILHQGDPRRRRAEKLEWLPEAKRDAWVSAEAAAAAQIIDRDARQRFGDRSAIRPVQGHEPDAYLCEMGKHRALHLENLIENTAEIITLGWLNSRVEPLDGRPFSYQGDRPEADQLGGMIKRAMCPIWWRRQMRRACVRRHESRSINAGQIGVRRAWYCTSDTVRRRGLQVARNAAILAATELENEAGQTFTLAELVAVSPSAKPIRRGELMTRIRGCEEWALARGMVGVFTTNTAPSRFHSQGGSNPNHQGETPRDAQVWLCKTWARARAALQRKHIGAFGFRVAEPHKDACPHWHMLLWCQPAELDQMLSIVRKAWLKHEGDEPGAAEHRFNFEVMDERGAIAYIAKYISKNIDDTGSVGAEGHIDGGETLRAAPRDRQDDLFDTTPARRVESWAAAWGIRQFQAIGQPPVTVWRELRRVDAATAAGGTARLQAAAAAVHKDGTKRADWCAYMTAQGGAMRGRRYLLRLSVRDTEIVGAYETKTTPKPYGVFDVSRPTVHLVSNRKQWKPRGTWTTAERSGRTLRNEILGTAPKAIDPPWTRFSNCTEQGTRAGFGSLMNELLNRNDAMSLPKKQAGGPIHHQTEPPPCHAPPH